MGLVGWPYDPGWVHSRPTLYGLTSGGFIIGNRVRYDGVGKLAGIWPIDSDGWPLYQQSVQGYVPDHLNFPFGYTLVPYTPP